MGDTRKHRGPHPEDCQLFRRELHHSLREAVSHLSWLLSHGYAMKSSLKLVGDRFHLTSRQRLAVQRSSVSDEKKRQRFATEVQPSQSKGQTLLIDGFNLLTTIEVALSGGVLLIGRDRCLRDMASMHGSYHRVEETRPALKIIAKTFQKWQIAEAIWFFDRPVSNSGRLKRFVEELAAEYHWPMQVELVPNPDTILLQATQIVVSADAGILDHCPRWLNAAAEIVATLEHSALVVDLR